MSADDHAAGRLCVDLDALGANYRLLRGKLKSGSAAAAVVKADGYGLGMVAVARALAAEGCADFFVADIDEGVTLRRALPKARIYILGGCFGAPPELAAHGLTPVLNHPGEVAAWRDLARIGNGAAPSALHLDTGMNRLGLSAQEAAALAVDRAAQAELGLALILSHLVVGEEADDPLNQTQLGRFAQLLKQFPPIEASLANSSGVFLGAAFHFNLVRPGAALYGIAPQSGRPNPMAQVVRLQGRILQVRSIDRGETVGYGAAFRAARKSRIATVSVGYADGYLRSLGQNSANRTGSRHGTACLNGVEIPVIGRVSMDLITVDLTGLPDAAVFPGQYVDLIGPHRTVDALAQDAGTIGYEILTRLGPRLRRVYAGGRQ